MMNPFRKGPVPADLVCKLKSHDPEALGELYDCFGGLVYSIALRAVRNPAIAEDLTQETFLHVWRGIEGFSSNRGELGGWITAIARNQIRDYFRSAHLKAMRKADDFNDLIERLSIAGRDSPDFFQSRSLKISVSSLGEQQRMVVELSYLHDLSQTQIAAIMGKPLGTVKTWARQALISLRQQIADGRPPRHKLR